MAFFRNRTVNLLNLHYGVRSVATTGGGAFFCVYLLRAGVPLPGVLAAMAFILLGRLLVRPAIVPLATRIGLRPLVIAGTCLGAGQYLILPYVHGVDRALAALCVVSGIADTVYWSTYHAYFAALGDDEHRGHQLGMREAVAAVVGIISPVATGWVLVGLGPMAAFGATAAFQIMSALPLFLTPQVIVERHVPDALKTAAPGIKLFLADGWIGAGRIFVWQLALFISLDESFINYGGALAIAALVGAIAGLYLGRHIDAGHGGRAVLLALGSLSLVIVLRAASPGHPSLAVIANALASVGSCLYIPTLMTAVYNQAKRSPCALRFHVATEAGWDIGGASGLLIAALMLYLGAPLSAVLLLPLLGIVAVFIQLRAYYAQHTEEIDLLGGDLVGGSPSSER